MQLAGRIKAKCSWKYHFLCKGLSCFTGFPFSIANNKSVSASWINYTDEDGFHSAGPLNISKAGKVPQISGGNKHAGGCQEQFSTCNNSYLFRLLRVNSLNSTYIRTAVSANPKSSTSGKEIETNTNHDSESRYWKKDFNTGVLGHSTSNVSLLCTHTKMMFCTIPLHTEEDSWQSGVKTKLTNIFVSSRQKINLLKAVCKEQRSLWTQ